MSEPAFPGGTPSKYDGSVASGLTKREWFAGQVLSNPALFEMAKDPFWKNLFFNGKLVPQKDVLAALAVYIADAMIAASKEGGKP